MVPEQPKTGGDMAITWEILIAGYMGYLLALGRPASTRGLRSWQVRHLAASLNKPPNEVRESDLLAFFADHPWRPETRRSMRAAVRGFFGWAHRNRLIDHNPAEALPQYRVPKAVARPCPDERYRSALLEATPRVALMLRLAREAGLRRAEIARIHRRDLQHTPGGWSLLVHGKGAHERVVPITDDLAAALNAPGYMFPSQRGGCLTARSVGVMCSAALGEDVTLHMLRHSFATAAYRGSRNLAAVQKLLGHASLAVTERYLRTDDDELRAAAMSAVA